jgi:hypothetical protein
MSTSDHSIVFCINQLAHANAEALSAFIPQGIWHFAIVMVRGVGTASWTIQL